MRVVLESRLCQMVVMSADNILQMGGGGGLVYGDYFAMENFGG